MNPLVSNVAKALARDAVFFTVILVSAELGLRVAQPQWAMPPSGTEVTRGHPIVLNSMGMRDGEFQVPKPAGRLRVAVFGNSTTFGAGVAEDVRFTTHVERALQVQYPDQDIEVLNLGGLSNGMTRFQAFLDANREAISPDVVVVAFSPGMLTRSADERRPASKPSSLSSFKRLIKAGPMAVHVALYGTWTYPNLDAVYRLSMYRTGILHVPLDGWGGVTRAYAFDAPGVDMETTHTLYDGFESDLAHMKGSLRADNIPLVLLSIPSQFEVSERTSDNVRNFPTDLIRVDPNEQVQQIAENLDLPFVSVADHFKQLVASEEGSQYQLFLTHDYTHLDVTGHRETGVLLATELVKRELLPVR